MITIQKVENERTIGENEAIRVELRGLSTETMPLEINGKLIDNGSEYICIDTGDIYLYDLENQEWHKM